MNKIMMSLEEFSQLSKQEQYNTLVDYVDKYGKNEIKKTWKVSAQWINNRLYPLDTTLTKNKKTKTRTSKKQAKGKNISKRNTSLKNKETELNTELNLESTKLDSVKTILNEESLKEESVEVETPENVKVENCGFEVQLNGLMSASELQERLHKIADTLLNSKEYNITLNLKER